MGRYFKNRVGLEYKRIEVMVRSDRMRNVFTWSCSCLLSLWQKRDRPSIRLMYTQDRAPTLRRLIEEEEGRGMNENKKLGGIWVNDVGVEREKGKR